MKQARINRSKEITSRPAANGRIRRRTYVGTAMSALPFVAPDADGVTCGSLWAVTATGNYATDFRHGQNLAAHFVQNLQEGNVFPGLWMVVEAMAAADALSPAARQSNRHGTAAGFLGFFQQALLEGIGATSPFDLLKEGRQCRTTLLRAVHAA